MLELTSKLEDREMQRIIKKLIKLNAEKKRNIENILDHVRARCKVRVTRAFGAVMA